MITSPDSVDACTDFEYVITYGNDSRNCAENVYTIFTMPNYSPGANAATPVLAVYPEHNEEIYYQACPYEPVVSNPPIFDPFNPTANGWTATEPLPTDYTCYIAIKATDNSGIMCLSDGGRDVTVLTRAADPNGTCAEPGNAYTWSTVAVGTNGNDDPSNDEDDTKPVVPNINLVVDIEGSQEWSFPCILPNETLTYTVNFRNDSNQPSCGNDVTVTISDRTNFDSDTSDSIILDNELQFEDPFGTPLTNITVTRLGPVIDTNGNAIYTYRFGGPLEAQRDLVCMPPQSSWNFTIDTTVDSPIPDQTNILSTVGIEKFTGDPEEILGDNTDQTQVLACRTDVMTTKHGIADRDEDGSFTGTVDSDIFANQWDMIEYTVEYDNLGNAPAENTVITELVPEGTCLNVSSLKQDVPAGATLVMYDAAGAIVDYPGAVQCEVRSFDIMFAVLPNPASFDQESCTRAAVLPDFSEYRDYYGLEDSMCEEYYEDPIGNCVDTWADNTPATWWLVAYYTFDAWDATDDSGNGHTGTAIGWVSYTGGLNGWQAANFDGIDDRIDIADHADLDITWPLTVSARVSPRQFAHGQWWLDYSTLATKPGAYYLNLNPVWRPQVYRTWVTNPGYHATPGAVPLSERSHVLATYDGSWWVMSIYVNGVLEKTSGTFSGTWNENNKALSLGGLVWQRYLDGLIDNVRVYDRLLSPREITELYHVEWGTPCEARDDGLVAYYTFDASDATDDSAQGHDGTEVGSLSYIDGVNSGKAALFDNASHIAIDNSSGDFSINGSQTVSLWFKTNAVDDNYLFAWSVGHGCDGSTVVRLRDAAWSLRGYSNCGWAMYASPGTNDNAWHHITIVTNDAGMDHVYVDGNLEVSDTTSWTTGWSYATQYIGTVNGSVASYIAYSWAIDNVRVYDRALSANQARAIYHIEKWDSCETRADDLILHYSFDNATDLAHDDSGAGHDGVIENGTAYTEGKLDGAASFDDVDDYITWPKHLNLTPEFSIGGWVYPAGTGWSATAALCQTTHIIGKRQGSACTNDMWWLWYTYHGASTAFDKKIAVTRSDGSSRTSIKSSEQLERHTRHHVMWTKVGDTGYLYINGELDSTMDLSDMVLENDDPFRLGRGNWNSYFNGKLDDMRIYERGLVAEEIERMYRWGDGWLVAYYPFDDGTADDQSGEENDGTFNNGASTQWGLVGQTAVFDGSNDNVTVPDADVLDITDTITLSARVNLDGWWSDYAWLVSKTDSNGNGWELALTDNPDEVRCRMLNGIDTYITAVVWMDEWKHIACTYAATENVIRLYVDGELAASTPWNNGILTNTRDLRIARLGYAGLNSQAQIDEVRVYNRVLDDDEIAYLAQMSECSFIGGHDGTDEYIPSIYEHNSSSGSDTITLDTKQLIEDYFHYASGVAGVPVGTDFTTYGFSVDTIGDVNGDGYHDIVVGAPRDDTGTGDAGAAYIHLLGEDQMVIDTYKIDALSEPTLGLDFDDEYGYSVAGIGDVDDDGIPDIAVGAWQDDDGSGNRGAVYIHFLNADGTVRDTQKISSTAGNFTGWLASYDYFGTSVAGIGDLNGDAIPDIAVGTVWDDDGGDRKWAVYILFLDTDGTVQSYQKISDTEGGFIAGLNNVDYFGQSVDLIGDIDGNTIQDIAVGTWYDDELWTNRGAVYILFLDTDGTVQSHQKLVIPEAYYSEVLWWARRWYGEAVSPLGDINQDGVPDIAVGAPWISDGSSFNGGYFLHTLNPDGTIQETELIYRSDPQWWPSFGFYSRHGAGLASYPDADGDGIDELLVGRDQRASGWTANKSKVYFHYLNKRWAPNYVATGTYTTTITADTPVQYRDKLYLDQTVPTGTEIKYEILDATCTTSLIGPMTTAIGVIDLDDLDPAVTDYCFKVYMSTDNEYVTPVLDQWVASYKSTITPSFSFKVHLEEGVVLEDIDLIHNDVRITTDTPESDPNNNDDIHDHTIIKGDLVITKEVDQAVALDGDTLLYTLTYENTGPQTMEAVVIEDTLPTNVNYVSSTPSMTLVAGSTYSYDVGTLLAGEWWVIAVTATISGASNGDLLVNVTDIGSDETAETEYDNNNDNDKTIVNMLANTYTTVNAPLITQCIDEAMPVSFVFGNNGNAGANAISFIGTLDPGVVFSWFIPSVAGLSYISGSHTISWSGNLAVGEGIAFDVFVIPTYDYLSGLDLDDPWLVFTAEIEPSVGEFDRGDNYAISDDQATAELCELAAIQWHIYIDTDSNDQQDSYDPYYLSNPITVYLSGTDIFGNIVTGSVQTTNGEYFFGNLVPGSYQTYYSTVPPGYENQSSVGWFIFEYNTGSQIIGSGTAGSGSVNGHTSTIEVIQIDVGPGDFSENNDFGISAVYDLTIDKTLSGATIVEAGDTITWLLTYTLSGAMRNDISVIDSLPTWLVYQEARQFASPLTGVVLTWDGYTTAQTIQFDYLTAFPAIPVTIEIDTLVSPYLLSGTDLTNMSQVGVVLTGWEILIDPETNTGNNEDDEPITIINNVLWTIAGTVYYDEEDDDDLNNANSGISGQVVSLSGTDYLGFPITATWLTLSDGTYLFTGLASGNYEVSYVNSSSYIVDSAQTGSTVGTTVIDAQMIGTIGLGAGEDSIENDFGLIQLGSLGGTVYYDTMDNNDFDGLSTDPWLSGQLVTLSGTDLHGMNVLLTGFTNTSGAYLFTGLYSGSYNVRYTNSSIYTPDSSQAGNISGSTVGTWLDEFTIADIILPAGENSVENDFGLIKVFDMVITKELLTPTVTPGGVVAYRLWYYNSGDARSNIVLNDIYPLQLSYKSTLGGSPNVVVPTLDLPNRTLTWTPLALSGYATGYIDVDFYVVGTSDPNANAQITNTGHVETSLWISSETNTGNNDDVLTIYVYSSLDGNIYHDTNSSDDLEASDILLSGQTVSLYSWAVVIDTTITNTSGYYLFTGLVPGDYTVSYTNSYTDLIPFVVNTGTIGGIPIGSIRDLQTLTGITIGIFEESIDNDFGLIYITGSVAGTIYYDTADNDNFDGLSTDPWLSGQVITLSGTNQHGDTILLTGLTNGSGAYLFMDIEPGNYEITYTNSSPYIPDSAQVGTTTGTSVIDTQTLGTLSLNAGEHSIENDFGLIDGPGSIAGTVYYDSEDNDDYDIGADSGLSGIIVYIEGIDQFGDTITWSAVTNNSGAYLFDNLYSGEYSVWYDSYPSYYISDSTQPGTTSGTIASWVQMLTTIHLTSSEHSVENDFGLIDLSGEIAGTVYYDTADNDNFDGIPTDPWLSGQVVILSWTDRHGDSVLYTGITSSNGSYLFTWLLVGDYTITYTNTSVYVPDSSQIGTTTGTTVIDEQTISTLHLEAWEKSGENDFGLIALVDLILNKSVDYIVSYNGQLITWSIVVTNDGPSPAEEVRVVDALPPDFTMQWYTPTGLTGYASWSDFVWELGTLQPDEIVVISMTWTVSWMSGDVIMNEATVDTSTREDVLTNNTDDAETEIINANISLQWTVYLDADYDYMYTIWSGDYPLSGMVVVLSGTEIGWPGYYTTVTDSDGNYVFELATTLIGDYMISLSTTAWLIPRSSSAGTVSGTTRWQWSIQTLNIEPRQIESVMIMVEEHSIDNDFWLVVTDLMLEKLVTASRARVNEEVVYIISYENLSPVLAEDVTITDILPAWISFVSSSVSASTTDPLVFSLWDLDSYASGTITITWLMLHDSSRAPLINTAVISTSTPEISTGNNIDDATITRVYKSWWTSWPEDDEEEPEGEPKDEIPDEEELGDEIPDEIWEEDVEEPISTPTRKQIKEYLRDRNIITDTDVNSNIIIQELSFLPGTGAEIQEPTVERTYVWYMMYMFFIFICLLLVMRKYRWVRLFSFIWSLGMLVGIARWIQSYTDDEIKQVLIADVAPEETKQQVLSKIEALQQRLYQRNVGDSEESMAELLDVIQRLTHGEDIHFRVPFYFALEGIVSDQLWRIDPTSVTSSPVENDGMTYCSKTAKITLHALTWLPYAGWYGDYISQWDAISLFEKGRDTELLLELPVQSKELVIKDILAAWSGTIADVYTYIPHADGALTWEMVKEGDDEMKDAYFLQSHRFVVFLGTDDELYVLDPYRGEKTTTPQSFDEYVSRLWSSSMYVYRQVYLPDEVQQEDILWGTGEVIWGTGEVIWGTGEVIWGTGEVIWGTGEVIWGTGEVIWGTGEVIWGTGEVIWGTGEVVWGTGEVEEIIWEEMPWEDWNTETDLLVEEVEELPIIEEVEELPIIEEVTQVEEEEEELWDTSAEEVLPEESEIVLEEG